MDQAMVVLVLQSLKDLDGEATNEVLRNTLEIIILDKFI